MLEHPANYNASIVKERHGLMHLTNVLKDFMSIKKQRKKEKPMFLMRGALLWLQHSWKSVCSIKIHLLKYSYI